MDFTVRADHKVKIEEIEKTDKYLDFARELKKLCNMKVIVIPIVISALGIVPQKALEKKETGGIKNQRKDCRIVKIS